MSENETAWYLCNSKTQFQSNSLTWENVCKQCTEIHEDDAVDWHVWQESWPSWKPLNEVEDFYRHVKKKVVPPPPPKMAMPPPIPKMPPMPPMPMPIPVAPVPKAVEDTILEIEPVTLPGPVYMPILEKKSDPDQKRKHPRFDIRLRVIIRNAQVTFRTFSKDISLGGIALENSVPEHVFETGCQIFIAGPEGHENLRFDLGPTSRNDLRYFSFANLEGGSVQKLALWLEKYAVPKGHVA